MNNDIDKLTDEEVDAKLRGLYSLYAGRLMVGATRAMYAAGFNGVAVQYRPDTWTATPTKLRIRAAGSAPDKERLMLATREFSVDDIKLSDMRDIDAQFERDARELMAKWHEGRAQP